MSDISKMSVSELRQDAINSSSSGHGCTCIHELARRLEAAEADRDRWKAEALAWREVNDTAQAVNRLLRVHTHGALVEEAMKTSQAALGIAKAARAANERGE